MLVFRSNYVNLIRSRTKCRSTFSGNSWRAKFNVCKLYKATKDPAILIFLADRIALAWLPWNLGHLRAEARPLGLISFGLYRLVA